MSFQAKLILDDNEYNVLTVEYAITQPVDSNNRPNGRVRGGIIDLTVESGANFELIQWVAEHSMVRNGKIDFYRRDSTSVVKSVEFTDAFCIYLKEIFISEGAHPMVTKVTLTARELNIQSSTILNTWAGMHSESSGGSDSDSDSMDTENSVQFGDDV
ncbi:MAG: type VI secretion system tube protein TssD [Ferruginibacter sp.]